MAVFAFPPLLSFIKFRSEFFRFSVCLRGSTPRCSPIFLRGQSSKVSDSFCSLGLGEQPTHVSYPYSQMKHLNKLLFPTVLKFLSGRQLISPTGFDSDRVRWGGESKLPLSKVGLYLSCVLTQNAHHREVDHPTNTNHITNC